MSTDAFQRNRDNFCYRHPDRQSFVLCQRCLRTICPECQTPAAVGVVCPECLREQQKAQTPAQRTAQRRWSRARVIGRSDSRPLATYSIIGITLFTYLLQMIPGIGQAVERALWFWAPLLYPGISGSFEPWRLFTTALVHSSLWHVGLNMLALFMIGRMLEPMLGRVRFIVLYLLSALGGSVAVALLSFGTPVVGASGAIFGLFGALLIIGRHLGGNVMGIAIVLGINLVIGFIPGYNISWEAHVGGLIVGVLVAYIYTRTRNVTQRAKQIWLVSAVGVGCLLLLLIPAAIYA